jgi:hypothetical protein
MPLHRGRSIAVSGRRPQRRKLVWATANLVNLTIAAGAKRNDDMLLNLQVVGASTLGATVMRTHMTLAFAEATADTGQGVYLGLIVANAPTATNIDPSVDFGDDWMLLRVVGPQSNNRNTVVIGTNELWGQEIDLRAKRKLEELNERYFLCMKNNGSGVVNFSMFCRTLLALP